MINIEELERRKIEVDAAISNIMRTGQLVRTRNGRVEHASLSELRAERAAIEQQIADCYRSSAGDSWGTKVNFVGRG